MYADIEKRRAYQREYYKRKEAKEKKLKYQRNQRQIGKTCKLCEISMAAEIAGKWGNLYCQRCRTQYKTQINTERRKKYAKHTNLQQT